MWSFRRRYDIQVEYESLEHESTAWIIYRSTTEESFCYSISSLAVETLGSGLVLTLSSAGRTTSGASSCPPAVTSARYATRSEVTFRPA